VDKVMLISNPRAGSVSARTNEVIVKALSADFKLESQVTNHRDHAIELARDAVDRDFDAVLAFGGDGTINEVAQPLVGTNVALGLLPGGSTNVMARSLGVPRDPVEATAFVASNLRSGTKRRIGVGKMDDRYFMFSCGIGLDAEVVKRVEADVASGNQKSDWTFIKHALAAGATEYRTTEQWLTVKVPGYDSFKGVLGVCCNARPFTYYKKFPVEACPQARLDRRLDLLVMRNIRTGTIPRIIWALFVSKGHIGWKRKSRYFHDIPSFTWVADVPKPAQVDGDYIGERQEMEVSHVPDALDLLV
jgi:diacylglycerol kinase family enzyme